MERCLLPMDSGAWRRFDSEGRSAQFKQEREITYRVCRSNPTSASEGRILRRPDGGEQSHGGAKRH